MKIRINPKIIRADDTVKIVVPRYVTRVGYPKTVANYVAELEPRLKGGIYGLISSTVSATATDLTNNAYDKILHELGYLAAKVDSFGGPRRDLHFVDLPVDVVGHISQVVAVKTVQTGTYQKAEYSRGGWGYSGYDEDEYLPPRLAIDKVYRLARVYLPMATTFSMVDQGSPEIWMPVEFLQKVTNER